MALKLKIDICENPDSKSFYVNDLTGIYSASNTGGYGSPNPELTDIQTAVLEITRLGNPTVYTINVFPTFPTIDGTVKFTVLNTNVGLNTGDKLADDVWVGTLTETGLQSGVPFTATTTCYKTFTNQVDCCLEKKEMDISIDKVKNCEMHDVRTVTELKTILCNAKALVSCGVLNKGVETLRWVIDACNCGDNYVPCGCN